MQAVFRFVPDDRLRAVDHFGGDFLAAVCRQAVHEQGVRRGAAHLVGIHVPVGERFLACGVFLFEAHTGPDIRSDQIGAFTGIGRVVETGEVTVIRRYQTQVDVIAFRRGDIDVEAEYFGSLEPGVQHVVGIADPGDGFALYRAAVFDEREDIREYLAGMVFVGQTVDDGNARIGREPFDDVMTESANHDDVGHAGHDLCGVFDRFAATELAVAGIEIDRGAAQLVHTGLEREAGTCGTFFEIHDQRAIQKRMVWFIVLEFLFDDTGTFDQVFVLGQCQIGKLEIVFDCHKRAGRSHGAAEIQFNI